MDNKNDFERFYSDHFDKVYRFIFFRIGGNKDVAEDLVSDIFMKALKAFETYNPDVSQSAWIMTIAKNHLLNYWRDHKKTLPLPTIDESGESAENDSFWLKNSLIHFKNEEEKRQIAELLLKLEENEREIVTFHYLLGYSYDEIGEKLGMSTGAVKVAAHRAIKKMRTFV